MQGEDASVCAARLAVVEHERHVVQQAVRAKLAQARHRARVTQLDGVLATLCLVGGNTLVRSVLGSSVIFSFYPACEYE